jgi:hypothetical protein
MSGITTPLEPNNGKRAYCDRSPREKIAVILSTLLHAQKKAKRFPRDQPTERSSYAFKSRRAIASATRTLSTSSLWMRSLAPLTSSPDRRECVTCPLMTMMGPV